MNLQELFKEFYSKAKQVDTKEYVNSAKTSINSFSSLLEKRRQKASTQKTEEKPIEGAAAEQKFTEGTSEAEKSTDKAQESATGTEEQQQTEQKTGGAAEPETEQEQKVRWHQQVREKISSKSSAFNETVNEKFPKAASTTTKAFSYIKEVWLETFPNEYNKTLSKMERRKEVARLQKEYDDNIEHIENLQEQIPEWKRGAVVLSDLPATEERPGILSRLSKGVKSKLSSTKAAQDFMETEQYKNIEKIRAEMQEFKSNLREGIDNTQNPVIRSTRQATDMIFMESNCARAIKEMKLYDPDFEVTELYFEAEEIFKEFFCNFLEGNIEYLQKVCGMAGLAIVKGDLKRREVEGWRHKYTDILDLKNVSFLGGQVPEKSPPQFTFTLEVQEINCKVNLKDENEIKEGSEDSIVQVTYRIVLSRHDDPDMAMTGHYWEIVEFNKVGELQQIV